MALKIRLARGGSKKRPFYRIVVAEASAPRDGRFIEKLGTYNPLLEQGNAERVVINSDRVKHWMSVGALPSDRVNQFLATAGIANAVERREQTKKPLPKKKAQDRLKAQADAAEAEKAAKAEAVEAEKAAKLAAVEAEKAAKAEAAAAVEVAPVEEAPAVEEVASAEEAPAAEAPAEEAPTAEAPAEEAPAEAAPAEEVAAEAEQK
jgi:small subunit ribosomal protein S16